MTNHNTSNSFDKIYKETYRNVLKYVICNCSNLEDVKDIVQMFILKFLKI